MPSSVFSPPAGANTRDDISPILFSGTEYQTPPPTDHFDPDGGIGDACVAFTQYLKNLTGADEVAVIIANRTSRECALLKCNGKELEMTNLDFEHSIIAEILTSNDSGVDQPDESTKELQLINDLFRLAVNNFKHNLMLKKISEIDTLTQAPNRKSFEERMDREFKHLPISKTPLSLIMFDIDRFKYVNDTYGHQAGDLVLSEIARIVKSKLRDTDMIARYGGEEFAVILPETPGNIAFDVAERLRGIVEDHTFILPNSESIRITISLGVSDTSAHKEKQALIEAADQALYRAKNSGRNKAMS